MVPINGFKKGDKIEVNGSCQWTDASGAKQYDTYTVRGTVTSVNDHWVDWKMTEIARYELRLPNGTLERLVPKGGAFSPRYSHKGVTILERIA